MMEERKDIYFFYKKDPKINEKVHVLIDLVERYGFTVVPTQEEANIIVSLGGDGMFLQAVRKSGFRQDCLYAGISLDGSEGLYCDFHINDLHHMVDAMTMEKIEVRKYPVIEANIDGEDSFYCLNEFTIRSGIIKTLVLDVLIDGFLFETFRGDGMVISTPTGSTAYNKSIHGAVVDPLLPCIQVTEMGSLNNNIYRTLGSPFILSGERKLKLKVVPDGNVFPTMGMDNEAVGLQKVETVEIQLTDQVIRTIKLKDNSFFEKVKRTFL